MPDESLLFGPFHLNVSARLLLRDGKEVRLGGRGFDLLTALVERRGALWTKDELVKRVWANTFVEETNLRYQMANLRRILGDGGATERYIETVSGRGYCFVAPISVAESPGATAAKPEPVSLDAHNLPPILTRTIGRNDAEGQIANLLRRRRFVTIVGPGGIGKTTVALAVAWSFVQSYADGVRFVDLGPITDPRQTAAVIASAFGLTTHPDEPLPGVLAFLRNKTMLVLIDNCEHVASGAAAVVEAMLKRAPGIHLIATSREPLRAEGEQLYRLLPLASPPQSGELTVGEAVSYGAVELFAERAGAALDSFELTPKNVAKVCELCRRLDGIPLAIELAAARIGLGLETLFSKLADSSLQLMKGRRTAAPRQQTLYSTLQWSHDLLSEDERTGFRRLSLFRSSFNDEMAAAVIGDTSLPAVTVPILIAELVEKSLITPDASGGSTVYRLFETTRAYAAEKLAECNETALIGLRHALYYRGFLQRIETQRSTGRPESDWANAYRAAIDDVRAAIDWSLASSSHADVASDLLVLSSHLWFRLCLHKEYRQRVERMLQQLRESGAPNPLVELRLLIILAYTLWYSSHEPDAFEQIVMQVASLAGAANDSSGRFHALWGFWAVRRSRGQYKAAMVEARRFASEAKSIEDPRISTLAHRIEGLTRHYLGDQKGACGLMQLAIEEAGRSGHTCNAEFQLSWQLATSVILCRAQWLLGYPDQAIATAQAAIDYAQQIGHWSSLVYVLSVAGFEVSLWVGDLQAARRRLEMLVDHVEVGRESSKLAQCFEHILRLRKGSARDVLIASAIEPRIDITSMDALVALANNSVVSLPFPEIACGDGEWSLPERLRVDAEIALWLGGRDAIALAEKRFDQALEIARKQSTLSWELRIATSLCRLWRYLGRNSEAQDLLASVTDRFTEGFGTADLVRAKRLLAEG